MFLLGGEKSLSAYLQQNQAAVTISAAAGVVAVIAATATLWRSNNARSNSKNKIKPLHVEYRHPPLPSIINYMALLPQSVRRYLSTLGNKPKQPLDILDVVESVDTTNNKSSSLSPYIDKRELVPGKLWRVRYEFVRDSSFVEALKSIFGIDLLNMEEQVAHAPDHLKENIKESIQRIQTLFDTIKKLQTQKNDKSNDNNKERVKQLLEAGFCETQDMFIIQLNNPTAGLLLYNPCRIHPELLNYIQKEIGCGGNNVVEYIVSGSSSHTNQLPQATSMFPNAKIVCSAAANTKCTAAGMRSADYIYTDHSPSKTNGFHTISSLLTSAGVKMIHIKGDTFTQNLLLVAHKHLLDVDLTPYGNGQRYLHISDDDWNNTKNDKGLYLAYYRLLYFASAARGTVARGYLPDFRIMGCDPTSPFNKLTLDAPKDDGSSCLEMAQSLRKLLQDVEYDSVNNVHSSLKDPLPAAEFKIAVDKSWAWLDGKSLMMG